MQAERSYFKVISLLLQYPGEAYFRALPQLKSVLDGMPRGRRRDAIAAFIWDLEAHSVLQAQERYTALFDMNPRTTLNMTYHLWGDGEKRARLLTRLQQEYSRAGLEKTSPELPDFLPLILEFIAAVPQAIRSQAVRKSLGGIQALVEHLKTDAAPYADLLAPLVGIFGGRDKAQAAACPE